MSATRDCKRCDNIGPIGECVCGTHAYELGTLLGSYRLYKEGRAPLSELLADLQSADAHIFRRSVEQAILDRGRAPLRGGGL